MKRNQCYLNDAVMDTGVLWSGLRLTPEGGGLWAEDTQGMEQKQFQRLITILKGALALAAARQRQRPVRLGREDLPDPQGPGILMLAWYGRKQQEGTLSGKLMACYNGFGALPGGFPRITENLEQWLGQSLAQKLQEYIRAVRREEGDLAEKAEPYQAPPVWSEPELAELDRALVRAYEYSYGDGRGKA